ncbi:MAG: succinyl-diaminopimelate desuccinylase, partial [Mycetocola sp.]
MADTSTPVLDPTADSVELTRQLCDIASESGNEAPLADAIYQLVADQEHLTVLRYGNTIVARTTLGRARRVVIAGHIDTVPINNNVPTHTLSAAEDPSGEETIWGRGTVDM